MKETTVTIDYKKKKVEVKYIEWASFSGTLEDPPEEGGVEIVSIMGIKATKKDEKAIEEIIIRKIDEANCAMEKMLEAYEYENNH